MVVCVRRADRHYIALTQEVQAAGEKSGPNWWRSPESKSINSSQRLTLFPHAVLARMLHAAEYVCRRRSTSGFLKWAAEKMSKSRGLMVSARPSY